jgi:ribosomal-protein-alanine N-acetyltransferase
MKGDGSGLVAIRPADPGDLDAVASIERSVFADPWTRRSFVDLVAAPQVHFLVAVTDGTVAGYAIVLMAAEQSELANLAVARLLQGRGVGRRLLERAILLTLDRGCTEMFLEVRASNASAIHLYSNIGFKPVGRRVRYYARPVEDAIVMRAPLVTEGTAVGARSEGR